jgi:uncharacterized membrane protein YqjE
MAGGRNGGDGRSLGALVRDLGQGSADLVRNEVRLARLELAEVGKVMGKGTMQVAVGGVMALLGAMALLTGVVLLAGDEWLRDRYWLAALIVTAVLGAAAALLARHGAGLLTPGRLAPDETIATLREDKEWLKRQLTSGGISS